MSSFKFAKDTSSWDYKRLKAVIYTISPNEVDPVNALYTNWVPTFRHWFDTVSQEVI